MPVGNITEAIDEVVQSVSLARATLNASLNSWISTVFTEALPGPGAPFNESSLENRVVRNWKFQSLIVFSELPADPNATQADAQKVTDLVFRTCNAVRTGQLAGDITANQRDSVVAQYNISWPTP